MEDLKKKRTRSKLQKKWTDLEHNLLLNFLQENVDIEKPTAQIYYQKCLDQTKIDASPDMVRLKVRYWKSTFIKAEEWRKSTGAGLTDEEGITTINGKLKKICPYYDRLAVLFTNKTCSNVIVETTNFNFEAEISSLIDVENENVYDEDVLYVTETPRESVSLETPLVLEQLPDVSKTPDETVSTSTPLANRTLGQKFKTRMPKNGLSELAEIQKKRDSFYEKRLCIEKEKLALEKLKVSQEFELRKLELEQKERLAIMELKLKYNKE